MAFESDKTMFEIYREKDFNKKYSIANLSNIQNQKRRLIEPYRTLGLVIDFNQVSQFNKLKKHHFRKRNF